MVESKNRKTLKKKKSKNTPLNYSIPFLPIRDLVVFPYMIVPLFIGRSRSINAIDAVMKEGRKILLGTQKDPSLEEPGPDDLYQTGTVVEVLQLLRLPEGNIKILVEGISRVQIKSYELLNEGGTNEYFACDVEQLQVEYKRTPEIIALSKVVLNLFEEYVKLSKKIPVEIMMVLNNTEELSRVADIIIAHLILSINDKQELLGIVDLEQRFNQLMRILNRELEVMTLQSKIRGKVKENIEQFQKEYYLREQLKVIHEELGHSDEISAEIEEYREKLLELKISEELKSRIEKEINKLSKMTIHSAETTVMRNYLEWVFDLPWDTKSQDKKNIRQSRKILEEDHYGLEKIKERVLEYIAVTRLTNKIKGPILCLVGPPGVGKTSLARSIARALDRKYTRVSLGGVRDEAEIRGHRRTYIGAMPGKIIQGIRKTKTLNPVFLLDEVDKMSMDFRGDPSAALLEVLDPEQNNTFEDHYINLPFDLSDVMFITTANIAYDIPSPLLDRMELLNLDGYTEEEKLQIARKYLFPKQKKENGLENLPVEMDDSALQEIIRFYTREAGVRGLERVIGKVLRKVAKKIVESRTKTPKVYDLTEKNLKTYLGERKFRFSRDNEVDSIGIATGLAWTAVGGELLPVEVVKMRGKGEIKITGQLGDVMQESVMAAHSYLRSVADRYHIDTEELEKIDLHLHVPEGAIPKDGPSAGITVATAIWSVMMNKKIRSDIAMTGEITLTGKVLPVGGIKEKVLAAYRLGIREIIICEENKKDISDIPKEISREIKFHLVSTVDKVFKIAESKENSLKEKKKGRKI